MTETVHHCPPEGFFTTPCCGKTPFELPRGDRMTLDPSLVTCTGCLACSELDYGPCTCKAECGHLCCTGASRESTLGCV